MPGLTGVPWIQVALIDLQNVQAGPLVVAMQGTALASGQPDPTTQVIADTSDEIIGAIGFSGRYVMDASQGTLTPNVIPPNLKNFCVKKVVRTLRGRLNMTIMPDQIQDEQTYQKTLGLLREGRFPVDTTNNPSATNLSVKGGQTVLNPGVRRQFRPCQLRNL